MSNINTAFGLRPLGVNGSGPNSAGLTEYRIASNNTDEIWQGSPVIGNNAGFITRLANATGDQANPVGVFIGCQYVDAVTGEPRWSNYWPGGGALATAPIKAYVVDNPNQLFLVAASAAFASDAALQAAVFANANLANGNAGVDATGISSATLDVTTLATTANHLLRVVGISDDASNADRTAAGVGLIVRFNRHFNAPVGTTTGLFA